MQGKHCELVEYFKDDQYKTVQYRAVVDDGVGDSPELYNDCNNARDYYCEFKRFDVDKNATKLFLDITNNVKELLKITIKKDFLTKYGSKPVYPDHYELEISLSCGGKVVAKTNELHYETVVYADEVRGEKCELTEYFEDDKYEVTNYQVFYDDGKAKGETFNDCGGNYCRYSRYTADAYATMLDLKINNYVVERKDYDPYS